MTPIRRSVKFEEGAVKADRLLTGVALCDPQSAIWKQVDLGEAEALLRWEDEGGSPRSGDPAA
ncbi:hypothetical protein [Rhizobium sp. PAMB 3182]